MVNATPKDKVPFEIIITDEVFISSVQVRRRSSGASCASSVSFITTEEHDDLSSGPVPQYVEMTPGNYYEVVESRWEESQEIRLSDASNKTFDGVSGAPWPVSNDVLGYGTLLEGSSNDNTMRRPSRRGSLVMTLKKANLHQEDNKGIDCLVSSAKPKRPFRRGSLIMSFEDTTTKIKTDSPQAKPQVPLPPLARQESSQRAPIRPFRRASIVMNMARHPSEEATTSTRPSQQRGSSTASDLDMEYEEMPEPLQRVETRGSVPPKYPSRKASMNMSETLLSYPKQPTRKGSMNSMSDNDDTCTETASGGEANKRRRGSLVWTVTSAGTGGNEADHLCLKVSGFNLQERLDPSKNEVPRVPPRLGSMDTSSRSCAA